ncbi:MULTISPECIES: DNA repair protein RecO [unclassified Modicisalibacter]|uniref:DNA repair protein RecO n=1 Tax=unclassified Modicisalibacter TaxID=2679913 RepID=UPI001CD026D4|nr:MULTISPECIES: DNA repair protein RecO [unclassified Modicisalibacter]MBZ9556594.1 DNA repair protein RecO [Modicisalibacter sp. R2A 31.J]MBZ9574937.1 DNA repair protein RecO [Modicisalibacter sp. MOD 31.J]
MTPQPAYLLHRRPYRETSALVELITLDYGRVRAVAQGVQRAGSKSRSRLQPFAPLHVTWSGDNELKRLRLIETHGAALLLAGEGLLCGLYANELLTRLLPPMLPTAEVFAFYTAALGALPNPAGRAPALRRLEASLLETLDAEPVFLDLDDRELDPQARYVYQAGPRRFARAPAGQGLDGRTLRLLAQGDWASPGLAGAAKSLMRAALAPLLGAKPLRSRELMHQLAMRRRRGSGH